MYQFEGIPKTITTQQVVFSVPNSFDITLEIKDKKFLEILNEARSNERLLKITVDYGCIIVAVEEAKT